MPTLQASSQGLSQIKQIRKARRWAIDNPHWLIAASQILDASTDWSALAGKGIFASGVSLSTWKRFLRGEPINSKVFQAFCQVLGLNSEEVAVGGVGFPGSPDQDWGEAPRVSAFYGRTEELAILEQWVVQDRCQLVAVLGTGGIGKTTLLAKLGQRLVESQSPFQFVIWRSLLNAPPIAEILSEWIRFLSNQQETQLPERLDAQLARLRHYLQTQRCLLILDNFETVLMGGTYTGHYRPDYESYGQLLDQIGTGVHQSCLLMTSREKPQEIARLEGKTRPVRSLDLRGLGLIETRHIFAEVSELSGSGFVGSETDWQALVQLYSGNPLGLELAAKHIQQVFAGNIARFLTEGKPIFYDLLELLDRHFKRLSERERELIYWLAIQREPVTFSILREEICCPITQAELFDVLQSLCRRWTLERSGDTFTLQPVLMEYVTGQLVEQRVAEIVQGEIAAFNQYAIVTAIAKEYIRAAQHRLIVQPIVTLAIAQLGSQAKLISQLQFLLAELRSTPIPPGYAAGNLLNLFCYLKTNLQGYNFSHLPIWQADLQGATLHKVNFTSAQFVKSVFTQTFGNVLVVLFSPDGRLLATSNANGNIHLWRVEDGQLWLTLRGHKNWVRSVMFSPDSQRLVSSSEGETIKVWDLQDGTCIATLHQAGLNLRSVTLSPDGNTIAIATDDRTIQLWNLKAETCFRVLVGHEAWVLVTSFRSDGKQLASSSSDHTVRLWDVETGECLRVFTGHESWVIPVSFNAQGDQLVSAGFDHTVRIWDVKTGECLHCLRQHTGWIWAAVLSPDDRLIASAGVDRTIRIWDAETGTCLRAIQGHTKQVWSLAFHPDGERLASGSEDQTIRLWNIKTGQCLRVIKGHANWVRSVKLSCDGQIILTAHQDQFVRIWHTQTQRCLHWLAGHTDSVIAIAVSPQGDHFASAGEDRTIRIWQCSDYRCLQVLTGHTDGVWAIDFSADGQRLISAGCDHTVRIWDVQSGSCLQVLRGHGDRILGLACSPTQHLVASASEDRTIKLWDSRTGDCVRTILAATRVMSVTFSPDGQTLASGSLDTTIQFWNPHTGDAIATFTGHTGWVMALAFSADGQTLISGSCDQTLKVWQIPSGQCIRAVAK